MEYGLALHLQYFLEYFLPFVKSTADMFGLINLKWLYKKINLVLQRKYNLISIYIKVKNGGRGSFHIQT